MEIPGVTDLMMKFTSIYQLYIFKMFNLLFVNYIPIILKTIVLTHG
jgi:hypothetical protein